ncbi:hypothetical protein, partial [Klebsiella pneumoniae]|uniref:hypothetical protein n=2 Tax=Klebsiella pneumoniae TaxID=573 RepID=UPI00374EACE9
GTVCVVGKMRDLILQLSKSSIYSTKLWQNKQHWKITATSVFYYIPHYYLQYLFPDTTSGQDSASKVVNKKIM